MDENARPCPGCSERDRKIDELMKRVAELMKRVAELEKRLDDKERAGKRQAAPFSKGPPQEQPKTPGRQAGKQHGQHGHRPPPPADAIDETLEAVLPEACPDCGGEIQEDDDVDEQFQTDIPTKPIRRKIRIHKGSCKQCGRRVRGRHPLQTSDATGAAQSQIGPNAQASIVYLNKRCGMSYGKIADHLKEANGIDIKPSTATRIVLRAADKLQPVYQDIKESIKNAEVITPDETGWRNGGRPVWLHAWVSDQATCYVIDPHRSADALEQVIGLDYSGTLIHDGASSYDRFLQALHQQCVAHALRRAHSLEESLTGRDKLFPRQVINLMQGALDIRDAYHQGELDRADLQVAFEMHCDHLYRLTARPRSNPLNDTFARHLHHHGPEWFLFLLEPGQPATNYLAEVALRMPISNRKVFGGNRTAAGCQAQVITASTIRTCRQQKRSAFAFLRDAMCGLVQSIFSALSGQQDSTSELLPMPI
jgi:transposase